MPKLARKDYGNFITTIEFRIIPMEKSIRILIVDDHAIVREGLRGLIEVEPDMEVVARAR